MLFNSPEFAVFFSVVFVLYWFITKNSLKWQNLVLLGSSYFFYGWWDYRFLFLLAFSTLLDFFTGLKINEAKTGAAKKVWLWISIIINLGFLGFFKYYNFFIDSFAQALSSAGFHSSTWTLNIILPVGISFYTFHGLSYVFDIYRGKITPIRNFVDYSVFVSFFPLLVAGPIERATHLLPQVQQNRKFGYRKAIDGLRQILWGFFKKVVIADNCAVYVDTVFNDHAAYSGSTLVIAAVLFAFQIYGDFSGYSDIALGTARLLGFELLRNFAYPYFSRDIAEFWRRWHISLSSWFRDYVYIPLGGSKVNRWKSLRNTFIIFTLSGLWHGANWTFIVWGVLNALYFLPLLVLRKNRSNLDIVAQGRYLPTLSDFLKISITFSLTVFAWIFFRSENIHEALNYIAEIFSGSLLHKPEILPEKGIVLALIFFVLMEWFGREQVYPLAETGSSWPRIWRWSFYCVLIFFIFVFSGKEQQFIYFQF